MRRVKLHTIGHQLSKPKHRETRNDSTATRRDTAIGCRANKEQGEISMHNEQANTNTPSLLFNFLDMFEPKQLTDPNM